MQVTTLEIHHTFRKSFNVDNEHAPARSVVQVKENFTEAVASKNILTMFVLVNTYLKTNLYSIWCILQ